MRTPRVREQQARRIIRRFLRNRPTVHNNFLRVHYEFYEFIYIPVVAVVIRPAEHASA
jgi:hypothetical protein